MIPSALQAFFAPIFFVFFFLLAAAAPARAQVATHDFEDGTAQGWIPRGGGVALTNTTEAARSGLRSLRTTGRTQGFHGPSLDLRTLLTPGRVYQVTGWVRLVTGQPASTLVFTVERRVAGATSSSFDRVVASAENGVTDAGWVRLQGNYSFTTTDHSTLLLYLESSNATAQYLLDDFSIVELAGSGCPIPPDQSGMASDFETGTAEGWVRRGPETVAVSSADAHAGTFSLLTSGRTAQWNGPSINAQCKMHNGSRYRIGVWVKLAPGEPPSQLLMSLQRTLGGVTNFNTVLGSQTVTADAWTFFGGDYTYGFEATALSLYVESTSGTASFFIDDFSLVHRPPLPPQALPPVKEALADAFPIGVAIEPFQTSGFHSDLLLRHFNSITAENAMKFGPLQPTEGGFNFGPADTLANYARANGLRMRGHALVWHQQNPAWLFTDSSGAPLQPGNADHRALLLQRLETHIRTVVLRYADIVDSWDVVNEVIDAGQPGGLRQTPWLQIIGPDYIDIAFRITREVDPDAKLYINDFSTTDPAKRAALHGVVSGLIARGVPVNGVGHQMHVNIAQPSVEAIGGTIELFAALGLDNQITEFDMSVYTNSTDRYVPTVPEEILVLQGHRYKEIFREFRRLSAAISSVTLWGLADDTTWLKRFPITRLDQPLLFDEDLQAKHAYWGVVDPSMLPVLIQKLDVSAGTVRVNGRAELRWDLVKPVSIPSEGPLAATFKVLWDGALLYVLADVADPTRNRDDAIEVFVDGNNDKLPVYGPDDDHFVFERQGRFSCRHHGRAEARPRYVIVPTRGGYRLEAAIPLDHPAALGGRIGFDIRVRDGGDPPAFLSWSDTTHSQDTDTSRWGVITLVNEIEFAEAARGTPTIDGVEDRAWRHAKSIATEKFVLGSAGSTAVVKTLWDSGHLYVFARVTDNLLSKASVNPWEQDSVEIFVDQNNGKTFSYEADDAQYRVNFENTQSFGGAGSAAKFTTATRVVDGGYVVEAAIALDAIEARSGLLLGFDFQVNNDELGDGVRTSVATWSDETGRAFQDPSRFGVLRLRRP